MAFTNSATTVFTETLGAIAYTFAEFQPHIPMSVHLILSALFPIYTGAHASLSRPSSAAKPPSSQQRKEGAHNEEEGDSDKDEEEEEDSLVQKMEGLSNSDAILFPLLAGCTLAGLYMLIKYVGPETLNRILNVYFSSMAVFSVGKLVSDGLGVVDSFMWPKWYVDAGVLWRVKQDSRTAVAQGYTVQPGPSQRKDIARRSPLPGVFGRFDIGPTLQAPLWTLRGLLGRRYQIKLQIPRVTSLKATLSLRAIIGFLAGVSTIAYANLVSTPWYLTNLQGFAFSYTALQLMSPTAFGTGSLILVALFFYDIYFVFYTPMMVAVASKLDVPIKLLFPRPPEEGREDEGMKLAMLGLGDIVLPGIMIGLACRFDLWMHYKRKQTMKSKDKPVEQPQLKMNETEGTVTKTEDQLTSMDEEELVKQRYKSVTGRWGDKFWTRGWTKTAALLAAKGDTLQASKKQGLDSKRTDTLAAIAPTFPKPYFRASLIGYVLGMITTLLIMQVFHHAQPALLYLVPGVLGSIWSTALFRGELKDVWAYSEAFDEDEETSQEDKQLTDSKDKTQSETDGEAAKEEPWGLMSWFKDSFFSSAKAERNAARLEKSLAKSIQQDTSESAAAIDAKAKENDSDSKTDEEKAQEQKETKSEKKKENFHLSITYLGPRQQGHSQAQSTVQDTPSQTNPTPRPSSSSASSTSSTSSAVLVSKPDLNDSNVKGNDMPRWRKGSSGSRASSGINGGMHGVDVDLDVDLGDERAGKRVRTG